MLLELNNEIYSIPESLSIKVNQIINEKKEIGEKVYFSMDSDKNIKLTTLEDMEIFKALLNGNKNDT
ncbi:hypothetical protein [Campylobacter devanensis]|uniref:hypothetical protein n=1 Tax=Campylobacter devanensis TaxID=3161138 RepID=UPI000A34A132|nr:hypothetical protein [Campylobacter sp. P0111]